MGTPNAARHRDLEQRLRDLERKYADLVSKVLRRGAFDVADGDFVVDGGRLIAKYPAALGGEEALIFGPIGGTPENPLGYGLQTYSPTGDLVFQTGWDKAAGSTGTMLDPKENEVFDVDSQVGINAPYLQIPLYQSSAATAATTTSGSFVTVWEAWPTLWNPNLYAMILAYGTSANQGQIFVRVNDGNLSGTQSFNNSAYLIFNGSVPNFTPGAQAHVEVLMRRTAGTGTVACVPSRVEGRGNG